MATVFRHGGEAHVVRPDRVYRTSVLTPMVGYDPTADVQSVAMAFTQGPPLGTQLQGFGANPFAGWLARNKAAWNSRKAQKFMFAGFGMSPGPINNQASQVAPQMQAQMQMLRHLMQDSNAHIYGPIARAARAEAMRRPFTYYYAG